MEVTQFNFGELCYFCEKDDKLTNICFHQPFIVSIIEIVLSLYIYLLLVITWSTQQVCYTDMYRYVIQR